MSPPEAPADSCGFRIAAGFEGADHRNSRGFETAMLDASGHSRNVAEDYARLRAIGVACVRESIGWRRSERDGRFDFSCALRRADAARRAGIDVLWTFMHYGIPDGVGVDDTAFAERFAAFAHAAAEALFGGEQRDAPCVTPVNEISFMAWAIAGSSAIHPYRGEPGADAAARGFEVKRLLVRAAIAGADAIRHVVPGARMLAIDPLVHIVPAGDAPGDAARAAAVRAYQFQAYDMLCGRLEPELGGAARYLDAMGVNYYHSNQFELDTERRLHWHLRDPRRLPLSALLAEAHARYGVPLMIAETSHFGMSRGRWLAEVTAQTRIARRAGVPVTGLCVYPAADRPDWEDASHWHRSGLWDRELAPDGTPYAQWDLPSMLALREAARQLVPAAPWPSGERCLVVFAARGGGSAAHARALLLREHERCTRLLVVEPARTSAHAPAAAIERANDTFHVLAPSLPRDQSEEARTASLGGMVLEAIAALGASRCVAWLETPMARPLLGLLMPECVVYAPEAGAIDAGAGSVAAAEHPPEHALHHRTLLASATVRVGATEPAQRRARTGAHSLTPGAAGVPVEVDLLIIGGGAAAIAAALHAGAGALLIEREANLGGSRRSATDRGFVFDAVPHHLDVDAGEADAFGVDALAGDLAVTADEAWMARPLLGPPARAVAPALSPQLPMGSRPRGGIQVLIDALGDRLRCPVWRNASVDGIDMFMRCAWLGDGRIVRYRRLLATPALPSLLALLRGAPPPASPPALFAHALRCVHLGVRAARPALQWQLDRGAPFDRVVARGLGAGANDPRRALTCELPYSARSPLPASGSRLIASCVQGLLAGGVIASADDVVVAHETDCAQACIEAAPGTVAGIETWLACHGIGFVGSRGAWEPGHWRAAFGAGTRAAQAAQSALAPIRIAVPRR